MLILLPPSESKSAHGRGRPLDLARLSYPELSAARERTVAALERTSGMPGALARLHAPAGAAAEVARNTVLATLPTSPAQRLYTGVLYDALDVSTLDPAALRKARRAVVVFSAIFGVVRLADPVPAYRASIASGLDGLGRLDAYWRGHLEPVMRTAAGTRVVIDCRSAPYQAMWRPGAHHRWLHVRVPGASHHAKHTRGLLVRHLCEQPGTPATPEAVAEAAASAFTTGLSAPAREGQPWLLDVHPPV